MPNMPPETIANYLRRGPGPASMGYAADEWGSLGEKMADLTWSFKQMLVRLTDEWSGPVGMQVIEAAKPFFEWLLIVGRKLYETENQIERIRRGYWRAFDRVVPSAVIRANRVQRAALLNNPLGQNTYAIARLDQEYDQFWAENSDVWHTYRSKWSDALSMLTPWPSPPPIANNTGLVQPVHTDTDTSVSDSSASSSS